MSLELGMDGLCTLMNSFCLSMKMLRTYENLGLQKYVPLLYSLIKANFAQFKYHTVYALITLRICFLYGIKSHSSEIPYIYLEISLIIKH